MEFIIPSALVILMAGCASTAGYQPGDLSSRTLELQAEYCLETEPRERALRLAVLRALGVGVPASGVCTDILELLPENDGLDIDVEQAEEDRERFRTE